MTFEEALFLQVRGRYSDLLRGAVEEQTLASASGRIEAEIRWTLVIGKACRFLGRTVEGTSHAAWAVQRAKSLGRADLTAEALHVQALMHKGSGRLVAALATLEEALAILPPDAPAIDRAAFELERAELCYESGLPDEGRAALQRGGAQVQWLANSRLLAWVLYLKALLTEEEWTTDLQLASALAIARSLDCPELEWQILWRLAERTQNRASAEDLGYRALSILRKMAADLQPADVSPFWRQGARAQFLKWGTKTFGPSFREHLVLAPPVEGAEADFPWDPQLLPEFVRAGLQP